MKNKKQKIPQTASKSNSKIVERVNTLNTQIHDRSLFLINIGTSIKSGGVKLVLRAQTAHSGTRPGDACAAHMCVKFQPSNKS